jgi:hypothetical protein
MLLLKTLLGAASFAGAVAVGMVGLSDPGDIAEAVPQSPVAAAGAQTPPAAAAALPCAHGCGVSTLFAALP